MVIIPDTMTMAETMEALHMSRRSIERLCDAGRLRFARPTPRHILIYAEDVAKMLRPINI